MSGWQRCILTIGTIALLALIGLIGYVLIYLPQEQPPVTDPAAESAAVRQEAAFAAESSPQLRVFCGELQWFDGARWNPVEDFAALSASDPFLAANAAAQQASASAAADAPVHHNRALGTVPKVRKSSGGGSGGGGGGGGSSGGGGGGPEWSGDYE